MPRDSSGNYTLPGAYNPVVSGTAIQSAWANTTLADTAQALTDSLDRSGRGSMLAAFKAVDGAVGAPGLVFSNETTTGWWRPGAGLAAFSILGTEKFRVSASAFTSAQTIQASAGQFDNGGVQGILTGLVLGGLGSKYGRVFESANDTWQLGYSGTRTGAVTSVLQWNSAGNVVIAATAAGPTLQALGSTGQVSLFAGITGATNNPRVQFTSTEASQLTVLDFTGSVSPIGRISLAGTAVIDIAATRGVSIATPASGTSLAITGIAGNNIVTVGDGTKTMGFQVATGVFDTGFGSITNHAFNLMTNNTARITVANSGAVSMTGNSSGTSLTVKGTAGNPIALFQAETASDATVTWNLAGSTNQYNWYIKSSNGEFGIRDNVAGADRFVVTTTGNIYGKALHNNATSPTGTTNQYIASGTYTPTLTNVTNVAATTSRSCQWLRVGNVVTVSGVINIDPTTANVPTALTISLPIASNFTSLGNCGGSAIGQSNTTFMPAQIIGDATLDIAVMQWQSSADVAAEEWGFSFTYVIL